MKKGLIISVMLSCSIMFSTLIAVLSCAHNQKPAAEVIRVPDVAAAVQGMALSEKLRRYQAALVVSQQWSGYWYENFEGCAENNYAEPKAEEQYQLEQILDGDHE